MIHGSLITFSQRIIRAYNKLCEPILEEFDISQVSFDILMFIANNPEHKTASEISEIRHIKKNLVSVHVDRLVEAGLLERSSFDGDRRKITLRYTDSALPMIERGREMQRGFREALTSGVSDEEWQIFGRIHDKIEQNAESIIKNR